MHTFQPYPIDMLDINPFTKLSKEWALVTAGDKEKSNTMTVSWGGTGVLWGKNVVFIFIRESRYTKDFIDNGEFFSLSFLSEKYRDEITDIFQTAQVFNIDVVDKNADSVIYSKLRSDCRKISLLRTNIPLCHNLPFPVSAHTPVLCSLPVPYPLKLKFPSQHPDFSFHRPPR